MTTRPLIDPELLPVLDIFPPFGLEGEGLAQVRAGTHAMLESRPRPDVPVTVTEIITRENARAPAVRCLLFVPERLVAPVPAILHIHGGGYIAGTPEMSTPDLMGLSAALGCIILSVDYRLAPEHPFPAAVEDCHAALGWLHQEAPRLGVDTARIAVMGESAGGGLSAALALLARDRGEYPLAFQLLDCPMLDDRTCRCDVSPALGEFIWTRGKNEFGWTSLLGHAPGGEDVSPYAAAARADNLAGLPPAFIAVGALDLLLDEDVDYARRLAGAGVPVELHVYPGCFHGFAMAAESRIAKVAARDKLDALARAFTPKEA